jgi:hypothetical protein
MLFTIEYKANFGGMVGTVELAKTFRTFNAAQQAAMKLKSKALEIDILTHNKGTMTRETIFISDGK